MARAVREDAVREDAVREDAVREDAVREDAVREVERKYDVEPSFRLPDLAGLPGVCAVDSPEEQELRATYFDTDDLQLAARSITLRRRSGGLDAGWHLKLPTPDGEREEVRRPLDTSTGEVPAELRQPVEVYLRGAALRPTARLSTRRIVHRLRGADAALLAEVADDQVTAIDLTANDNTPSDNTAHNATAHNATAHNAIASNAAARTSASRGGTCEGNGGKGDLSRDSTNRASNDRTSNDRTSTNRASNNRASTNRTSNDRTSTSRGGVGITVWREIEVELTGGEDRLLVAADRALRAAGARPSRARSKLARVLADRLPAREPGPDLPATSAGAVVLSHLRGQVDALHQWDPRVRADAYDAVHRMRVTTRRLRSALATFRPLFDRSATEPIRAELKWLGGVLGGARDAEVTQDRLLAAIRAEPGELVLGPVARRVESTLAARRRDALAEARAALAAERYFRLLDALDALLAAPPLTRQAAEPAARVLRKRARAAWRRTRRAVKAAQAADDRDQALHEVRKAAKRARYAAESARPVFGAPARKFARRMKSVQQLLGEHQDTVVARAELRRLGVQAHLAGENGFSFGRLHALEQARAARAEDRYPEVWRAAAAGRWRRWMNG